MKCDVCDELSAHGGTSLHSIYAGLLEARIALRDCGFAALPTIGQLFEGSYLVIPTRHVEKYTEMSRPQRQKAQAFLADVERRLQRYGPTIAYEHGASSVNGTGCGVYHAHVHVVPLPQATSCDQLLKGSGIYVPTLTAAWDAQDVAPT